MGKRRERERERAVTQNRRFSNEVYRKIWKELTNVLKLLKQLIGIIVTRKHI